MTAHAPPLESPKPLTVEQLRLTFEFKALTKKQQRFVENYCTNGCDATAAITSAGYGGKIENHVFMGYEVLGHPGVQFTINLFFGHSPDEAFIKYLWHMIIKGKISKLHLTAIMLYADLRRLRHSTLDNAFHRAGEFKGPPTKPGRKTKPKPDGEETVMDQGDEDFLKDF
jgi:hypothetical protein